MYYIDYSSQCKLGGVKFLSLPGDQKLCFGVCFLCRPDSYKVIHIHHTFVTATKMEIHVVFSADIMSADRQLANEIEFDLRKFEEQQEELERQKLEAQRRRSQGPPAAGAAAAAVSSVCVSCLSLLRCLCFISSPHPLYCVLQPCCQSRCFPPLMNVTPSPWMVIPPQAVHSSSEELGLCGHISGLKVLFRIFHIDCSVDVLQSTN